MYYQESLKELLDKLYIKYNTSDFISNDPIQIPYLFNKKEDIELSGFMTATISWGIRKSIIINSKKLMSLMDNKPFEFITNANNSDYSKFENFKHRTFNGIDTVYFLKSLKNIYINHNGLENIFQKSFEKEITTESMLINFRKIFFELDYPSRTSKHFPNILKKSAAKKINMYLRWMIRKDNVDFGIWNGIPKSSLLIPLDVHVGNISRQIGLLTSKNNDLNAVKELTNNLKKLDSEDPVKYDFALFGYGVNKKIL